MDAEFAPRGARVNALAPGSVDTDMMRKNTPFFFQAEDGIRDDLVTGVQTCALPIYDLGLNFIRPQLITVPGAVVPNVYGGKQRSIMLYLDPKLLQAKGLSPADVLSAMAAQNVVLPGGTAKIGQDEYDIRINSSPVTLAGISNLPLRQVNGTTIYLHDVAMVSDGSIPQTNIVRQDGHRGVLVTVLNSGSASTLSVVSGIRAL